MTRTLDPMIVSRSDMPAARWFPRTTRLPVSPNGPHAGHGGATHASGAATDDPDRLATTRAPPARSSPIAPIAGGPKRKE